MKLAQQLRAQHVKRWGIVQVAREQTIAEHMYGVAVIAGHLATQMRWPGLDDPSRQLMLLRWALGHDLIEVLTGDLASPFKSQAKMLNSTFVEQVEDSMSMWCGNWRNKVRDTEIEMIVKLADMIEALNFIGDCGLGSHAREVEVDIRVRMTDMVYEYDKQYPHLRVLSAVAFTCNDLGHAFQPAYLEKGEW